MNETKKHTLIDMFVFQTYFESTNNRNEILCSMFEDYCTIIIL